MTAKEFKKLLDQAKTYAEEKANLLKQVEESRSVDDLKTFFKWLAEHETHRKALVEAIKMEINDIKSYKEN